MNNITIEAQETLRTIITKNSDEKIICDGVISDGGQGKFMSPLELMAGAIGACIITTMGIIAKRNDFDITGTKLEIEKTSSQPPGAMIKTLSIKLIFAAEVPEKIFAKLKRAVTACPAKNSLHPDIKIFIEYTFPNVSEIIKEEL